MLTLVAFPAVVGAQTGGQTVVRNFIEFVGSIVNGAIPVVIGLAVLFFLWGIAKYLIAKDSEEQKKAKGYIFWGIVFLFVMVSIWALVGLLGSVLGIEGNNNVPNPPAVPGL
jgi:hypothetical protein